MGHLLCLLGRRGSRLSTLVGHTCRSRCAGACRGASGQRCARYLYLYLSPVRTYHCIGRYTYTLIISAPHPASSYLSLKLGLIGQV